MQHRRGLLGLLCLILLTGASAARATDIGVKGQRLIIRDNVAASGSAKVVFKIKDAAVAKGADGNPALLSGTLDIFYTDRPCNFARFRLPAGQWLSNAGGHATYGNNGAPSTGGAVKTAAVKDHRLAKVVAAGVGEGSSTAIDLLSGGAPSSSGGITAVLTIVNGNDGSVHRLCTRFATDNSAKMSFGAIGTGTGRKLVAKRGVAVACSVPEGGVFMEANHGRGYFALPWPNDVRVNPDGSLDMAGYPGRATSAVADAIIGLGSQVTYGFGTNSAVFFQTCGAIDTASLPTATGSTAASSTAMLVNLDNPTEPPVPILTDFKAPATSLRPADLLTLLPYPGHTLRKQTRYAAIVFDGVTAGGSPMRRSPLLDELDDPWDVSKPVSQTRWDALRAQRDDVFTYVSGHTTRTSADVLAFTVYTTQDTTGELQAIAAAIAALPSPTPVSLTPGSCSNSRITSTGKIDLPKWQAGPFPYIFGGGAIVVSGGVAVQQSTERVNFSTTVPCGPAPVGGWPILLFMDGTGASENSNSIDYIGGGTSDPPLPYLVASIAPLYSGDRQPTGLPPPDDQPEFLFFNYLNPLAGRTNQIQQASEMMYLRRIVEGLPQTNASVEMAAGHSQGALTIPHIMAEDPSFGAGFISSGGGGLFLTVLHRGDTRSLIDTALGAGSGELDMFHPAVHALQTLAEVGDAANYAPLVSSPHVLSTGGLKDGCSPLEVVSVSGTGMGLPVANPLYYPMFGTLSLEPPTTVFPVSGNLSGGRTGVTVQLDTGHFGSITNPTLGRSYADSFAGGATPTVNPTLPLLTDSWFGCMRYDPLP
jgi:hypothetical protein